MNKCSLCPRDCGVNRETSHGVCGVSDRLKVARAALHFWEEPCISGDHGSGAVFFSGCALHCIYCQNREISGGKAGLLISADRLTDIFFELKDKKACNINLVTGDHYTPIIVQAIEKAKSMGFDLPFIFNCSGYEKTESLKMLEGLIDVYLPDLKYMDPELARRYSNAPDYPDIAKAAVDEMVRQCPECLFDGSGLIQGGVIVRHLLLPGHVSDSKRILRYLHDRYGDSIYISIMSQYTPVEGIPDGYPELQRRVKRSEYDRLTDYAIELGIENAYIQDMSVAKESFIPAFDNEGVSLPGGTTGD